MSIEKSIHFQGRFGAADLKQSPKELRHDQIERQTQEFLARGGSIDNVPLGVGAHQVGITAKEQRLRIDRSRAAHNAKRVRSSAT